MAYYGRTISFWAQNSFIKLFIYMSLNMFLVLINNYLWKKLFFLSFYTWIMFKVKCQLHKFFSMVSTYYLPEKKRKKKKKEKTIKLGLGFKIQKIINLNFKTYSILLKNSFLINRWCGSILSKGKHTCCSKVFRTKEKSEISSL